MTHRLLILDGDLAVPRQIQPIRARVGGTCWTRARGRPPRARPITALENSAI